MEQNGRPGPGRPGRADAAVPAVRAHILFVDDDANLAELARLMLTRLGCRATVCTDSTVALRLFRDQPDRFDAVITDQIMPGLSGTELAVLLHFSAATEVFYDTVGELCEDVGAALADLAPQAGQSTR